MGIWTDLNFAIMAHIQKKHKANLLFPQISNILYLNLEYNLKIWLFIFRIYFFT